MSGHFFRNPDFGAPCVLDDELHWCDGFWCEGPNGYSIDYEWIIICSDECCNTLNDEPRCTHKEHLP